MTENIQLLSNENGSNYTKYAKYIYYILYIVYILITYIHLFIINEVLMIS